MYLEVQSVLSFFDSNVSSCNIIRLNIPSNSKWIAVFTTVNSDFLKIKHSSLFFPFVCPTVFFCKNSSSLSNLNVQIFDKFDYIKQVQPANEEKIYKIIRIYFHSSLNLIDDVELFVSLTNSKWAEKGTL